MRLKVIENKIQKENLSKTYVSYVYIPRPSVTALSKILSYNLISYYVINPLKVNNYCIIFYLCTFHICVFKNRKSSMKIIFSRSSMFLIRYNIFKHISSKVTIACYEAAKHFLCFRINPHCHTFLIRHTQVLLIRFLL